MTASRVPRSKSMAPLTTLTKLGVRSWRRLSCTSICFQAFSVSPLSWINPLYAEMPHTTAATIRISRIHDMTGSWVGVGNGGVAGVEAAAGASDRQGSRIRTRARLGGLELVLLGRCLGLTLRLAQQPGGDQTDGVGDVLVRHAAAGQRMLLVDVQLEAPADRQPMPAAPGHRLRLRFGVGQQGAEGAARTAPRGCIVANQGQAGRGRHAG